MNREELRQFHVGENLDHIMNLDPRGYGVSRILYKGSRTKNKLPLTISSANALDCVLEKGDLVYIITGFILLPFHMPEMDGMVGSILLARALITAYDVKPVIICPEDNKKAVFQCANAVGLHVMEEIEALKRLPFSMGIVTFTKDKNQAEVQADRMMKNMMPKAVISIEAPGANCCGEYHNAVGMNVTDLEAKTDILFEKLRESGVLNIAIGDLGNEIGMGAIADHIKKYIPYSGPNQCQCECQGGILAKSVADHIITATVSDWGCYGMIAALAFLKNDLSIMHTGEMERNVMEAAAKSGIIDMTGSLRPGIDGFDMEMNVAIVELMRQSVGFSIEYRKTQNDWFEKVIEKEFYVAV